MPKLDANDVARAVRRGARVRISAEDYTDNEIIKICRATGWSRARVYVQDADKMDGHAVKKSTQGTKVTLDFSDQKAQLK